ncbi:MAG: ribosomal protein methyltransferase [Sphingobacteriaceae bacterium]|jgi:ribosomal protein L11 methyltransferase|nr:ribosomal protein methyltransferase [Sphingobacteriaceae bacterium]
MDYKELVVRLNGEDYQRDMLIYSLGEIGFDTFEETDEGFKAYIPEKDFDENSIKNLLNSFPDTDVSYRVEHVAQKNWNEVWESNFEPISIGSECYVRATFHQPRPEFKHEIVIDPKMAFGTGHHQTTAMMMEFMLEESFEDKSVLDMGCGTGILAILAQKLGSKDLVAIDNDELCLQSTIENSTLNHADKILALCGSKEVIPDRKFDIILANINRNILLDQLARYSEAALPNNLMFLSGFYEEPDMEIIVNKAASLGFKYKSHKSLAKWAAVKFVY